MKLNHDAAAQDLAGCGPAFVYLFIEALNAGVQTGLLPRKGLENGLKRSWRWANGS